MAKRLTAFCKEFWVKKGFSESDAIEKVKQIQSNNSKKFTQKRKENPKKYKRLSPMQIDFWVKKGLTRDEADFKIKSFRKLNKEYWTSRGFSEDVAKQKIKEFQKENGKKYGEKLKQNPEKYLSSFNTKIEYWIDKCNGDIIEATKKLHDRQNTGSLEKFKKKYGEKEGKKKFKERQEKWQNTLKNKSPEEIKRINKLKDSISVESFIRKGFGKEEALAKNQQEKIKRISWRGKASKQSLEVFLPFYEKLLKMGISDNDIYFGYKDKNEWFISSKDCFYLYDFTVRSKKIIIEFNGSKFHFNENKHNENWRSLYANATPEESMKHDKSKKDVAQKNGFKYFVIWDDILNEKEKIEQEFKRIFL